MALDTSLDTSGPTAAEGAIAATVAGAGVQADAQVPTPAPVTTQVAAAGMPQGEQGGAYVSGDTIRITPQSPPEGDQEGFGAPAPTQTAGLKETLQAIRGAARKGDASPPLAQPGQPFRQVGTEFIVREATADELAAFDQATRATAQKLGVVQVNLENVKDGPKFLEDYANRIAQVHEKQIDEARRGVVTWEQTLQDASAAGLDDAVAELLDRPVGQALNAEQLTRARLVVQNTDAMIMGAATKIVSGNATPKEIQQFPALLGLSKAVTAQALGARAEAGRSLNAMRMMIEVTPERLAGLESILQNASSVAGSMAPDQVMQMALAYKTLNTPYQRARFARQSLVSKAADVWSEAYVNALLSSPVTHLVNTIGNAAYIGVIDPAETAVAGAIGKVRSGLFDMLGKDPGDRVYMSESLAKLTGIMSSLGDSMRLAGRAWMKEAPIDPITKQPIAQAPTKIDNRVTKAITAENFALNPNEPVGIAVNWLGYYVRLPGRFLIAEDEFFKGVARQAAINAAAQRQMMVEIGAGVSPAQARISAAQKIANPDPRMIMNAQEAAEYLTFQQDLTGFMGAMQGVMSHPALKVAVPFFKTPTNIATAVMSRSPLAVALPSVRADLAAGGARADAALARIAVGSAVMTSFAWTAGGMSSDDFRITGAGPSDPGARAAWKRQGFAPYSFATRQKDGSWKSHSYQRMDPYSGILAMAADYAEYANYHPKADELEQLLLGGVAGLYNYMSQQPFLQALFEINQILGPEYETGEQKGERVLELLGKYAGQAALVPMPGGGAASSGIEKAVDETVASKKLPAGMTPWGQKITEANPMIRGFYEALSKYKAGNPYFASDVAPELNLWGEEVKGWDGGAWSLFNPIRIQTGKYRKVDAAIAELDWPKGPRMPDKKIEGVLLDAEQYNRLIKIANSPDPSNGETMLDTLHQVVSDPEFRGMSQGDKQTLISKIVSDYYSSARKQLVDLDPTLRGLIEQRKITIKNYGTPKP